MTFLPTATVTGEYEDHEEHEEPPHHPPPPLPLLPRSRQGQGRKTQTLGEGEG